MEFILCLNFLGIVENLNNHLIVSLAKSKIFGEWENLLGGEKKLLDFLILTRTENYKYVNTTRKHFQPCKN